MLRALLYAYVLGGLTFIPLVIGVVLFITIYTSVPVGDADVTKRTRGRLEAASAAATASEKDELDAASATDTDTTTDPTTDDPTATAGRDTNDLPRTRKGWLTMRRTFLESAADGGYVTLVRAFLDARSKDPRRARPRDMWYAVLKGSVLFLYEDEEMTECGAALELAAHEVLIYPEGLPDGELFAKRNALCLRPRCGGEGGMSSVTREMQLGGGAEEETVEEKDKAPAQVQTPQEKEKEEKERAREEALDPATPWFIFVRSNVEMEDWYFALLHASEQPPQAPTLAPLRAVFDPAHMHALIAALDEQPDVIPMRWLNALLGRVFLSHYRTQHLEAYIIGRLMKKLSKVKRPAFLTEISVSHVSVGNRAPMLSKPMLKELTKEGDASIEVHMKYKGEVRIIVEATAVINLGARFKSYTVKLQLAAVIKELEGNMLIKIKRPPSNRIWYAFTQTPRMVLEVEPIVSDRQITWGMILGTIESKFKEIIQESVVMPNMDDIAFFETGTYEHRGGIFAETCRKPDDTPPVADDAQSVASAPLPETSPAASATDAKALGIDEPTVHIPRAATDVTPTTVSAALDDDSVRNSPRRRSWFSGPKSDDGSSADAVLSTTAEAEDESRGRTLSPEAITPARSRSTPKPESPRTTTPEPHKMPAHARRMSSSHFSLKGEKETDKEKELSSSSSSTRSTPSTPRKPSADGGQSSNAGARPASPPSFFSTLKSKAAAADKQALGNTAKEAMRKWGVNWAGFKKDAGAPGEEGGAGTPGSPPPRGELHPESTASMLLGKARTGYAEVRAAVAERKERERLAHVEDGALDAGPSRARVVSTGARPPNGSMYLDAPSNPGVVSAAGRQGAPRLSNAKKAAPSVSSVSTDADALELPAAAAVVEVEEPTPRAAPIHVQPVAKTMSIPGIHASHRGDVQSMGHVAAPPPAAPAPAPGEAMLKNPAIQTVYRLWKTPSGEAAAAAEGQTRPRAESLRGAEAEAENATELGAVVAKPTPPPLPPRSHTVTMPAAETGSAEEALKTIARKDESSRTAGEAADGPGGASGVEAPGPTPSRVAPALPPRRVQAPV